MEYDNVEDIVFTEEQKLSIGGIDRLINGAIHFHTQNQDFALDHEQNQIRPTIQMNNNEHVESDTFSLQPENQQMFNNLPRSPRNINFVNQCMEILKVPNLMEHFSSYF